MIDEVVRLAGTGSGGTQNDLAAVDMIQDGAIVAVAAHLLPREVSGSDLAFRAEVSFLSTNQIQQNDARGTIAKIEEALFMDTQVGSQSQGRSLFLALPAGGIPVNAGERIHLHYSGSTGADAEITFDLYLDLKGSTRRAGRRN